MGIESPPNLPQGGPSQVKPPIIRPATLSQAKVRNKRARSNENQQNSVKKYFRSFSGSNSPVVESPNITTQNQFQELDGSSSPLVISKQTKRGKVRQKQFNQPNEDEKKMKPIVVEDISPVELNTILSHTQSKTKATFAKKYNSYHIQTYSKNDKDAVIKTLDERKHKFHSFLENDERPIQFVLRGHHLVSPDSLLASLAAENIPAKHVGLLVKNEENPLFTVNFARNSITLASLNNEHKTIGHLRVTWEKRNFTSKRPTQCTRCQRWGHSHSNCHRPLRCVKCNQSHEKGQCERINRNEGQPYCVNCAMFGHPSNSPTCEKFIAYKEFINSRRKPATTKQFTSVQAPWAHQQRNNNFNYNRSEFPSLRPSAVGNLEHNVEVQTESRPMQSREIFSSPTRQNAFEKLDDLNQQLLSIPGLDKAILCYTKLINDLTVASPNEHKMAQVLYNFHLACE